VEGTSQKDSGQKRQKHPRGNGNKFLEFCVGSGAKCGLSFRNAFSSSRCCFSSSRCCFSSSVSSLITSFVFWLALPLASFALPAGWTPDVPEPAKSSRSLAGWPPKAKRRIKTIFLEVSAHFESFHSHRWREKAIRLSNTVCKLRAERFENLPFAQRRITISNDIVCIVYRS